LPNFRNMAVKPSSVKALSNVILNRREQNCLKCSNDPVENIYTTEKNGVKKIIIQKPWIQEDEFCGVVEISFELPLELPKPHQAIRIDKTEPLDFACNSIAPVPAGRIL
jgi:hypothetical protein